MALLPKLKAFLHVGHTDPTPQTPIAAPVSDDHAVVIYGHPTRETFDEETYLDFNPDIADAVRVGAFASGRAHFEEFGHLCTHKVPIKDALGHVTAVRRRKAQRIAAVIRADLSSVPDEDGVFDFLTPEIRAAFGVVDTTNVSSNDYDAPSMALIHGLPDGLILDCGAGSRPIYHDNVVNYEIARYPSTDVLGVAEQLPFKDDSFDAVFSYAVLEHVKRPFMAAKEISRVLKPDGTLRVIVPFLQPLHGYPSHYFNMTQFGLRTLFEDDLEIGEQFVGRGLGPIWTMYTLIRAWHQGLPETMRKPFLDLKLKDLFVHPIHMLDKDFVVSLSETANFEIASATGLVATKPGRDPAA